MKMTNQKLINVFVFTAGAAIGSLVTWSFMKKRCERYIQEEIDKFVDDWSNRDQNGDEPSEDTWDEFEDNDVSDEEDFGEVDIREYHLLAKKYGEEGEGGPGFPYVNGPVVITPDEFGDGNYGHSLHCLTYYSDGVLSNDWYEVLDIEDTIGEESLKHFGDYAEDVVHVRNEQNCADYEVVRDPRTFAEVTADDPLMAMHAT